MQYHNQTLKTKQLTGSRKHQFGFGTCASFTPHNHWDGGSRSSYAVHNTLNGFEFSPPCGVFPAFISPAYTLQPGEIVIITGTFSGKPATPRIECREEDLAAVKTYLGIV